MECYLILHQQTLCQHLYVNKLSQSVVFSEKISQFQSVNKSMCQYVKMSTSQFVNIYLKITLIACDMRLQPFNLFFK